MEYDETGKHMTIKTIGNRGKNRSVTGQGSTIADTPLPPSLPLSLSLSLMSTWGGRESH